MLLQRLKSTLAVTLASLIAVDQLPAAPTSTPLASVFSVSVPATFGSVTDAYKANSSDVAPAVILVQDLHVNRSVQFNISGILKGLKAQNLLPNRIAVEGGTGPVDIATMQKYGSARSRKAGADYLVRQGEMPGPMHFAVVEGQGALYGVETEETYKANVEMFRRTYKERAALLTEIDRISAALPRLKKDSNVRKQASRVENQISIVKGLLSHDVIPEEMPMMLTKSAQAIEDLKAMLPAEQRESLVEALSAAINFYGLALLRDEDLFKNTLAMRDMDHQTTTVLVVGGFHTPGITEQCRAKNLSYVVISPNVKRHTKIDQKLYVERLLGNHLSEVQVAKGLDYAAMMVGVSAPEAAGIATNLLPTAVNTAQNPVKGFVAGVSRALSKIKPSKDDGPSSSGTASAVIGAVALGALANAAVPTTAQAMTIAGTASSALSTGGLVLGGIVAVGALAYGYAVAGTIKTIREQVKATAANVSAVRLKLADLPAPALENVKGYVSGLVAKVPGLSPEAKKREEARLLRIAEAVNSAA